MKSALVEHPVASKLIPIAWAGWELAAPETWRPMRVEGNGERGLMLIGDAVTPLIQVKWTRVNPHTFNWTKWQSSRLRTRTLEIAADLELDEPFDASSQFVDRNSGRRLSLYYSSEASQAIEIVEMERDTPTAAALGTLRVTRALQPMRWSVFDCSYMTPSGYSLQRCKLNLGHQALEFRNGSSRLILEQVYPARLALTRRNLDDWLRLSSFRDRRVTSSVERKTGTDGMLVQECVRRLPFPLGGFSSRQNLRLAMHSPGMDRIFLAENDTRDEPNSSLLNSCIDGMQWATGGGQ